MTKGFHNSCFEALSCSQRVITNCLNVMIGVHTLQTIACLICLSNALSIHNISDMTRARPLLSLMELIFAFAETARPHQTT